MVFNKGMTTTPRPTTEALRVLARYAHRHGAHEILPAPACDICHPEQKKL